MTRQPPPFEQVRIPTLLVLGETSYLPYDELLGAHQDALGELLEVAEHPGRAHGAVGRARRNRRRGRALLDLGGHPCCLAASTAAASASTTARSSARSSASTPFASRWSAFGTATVSSIVRAPRAPMTLRVSAAAQTPPNIPVLDESTATGLLRTGDSTSGREAQSSAFLSTPGIDELYSGVAIRIASAESSASLKRDRRAAGRPGGRRRRRTAGSP